MLRFLGVFLYTLALPCHVFADGPSRTTTFTHDPAGRLLTATLPGRGVLTYAYDAADQLVSVTDALGNQVAYAYDLKGNRTQDVTKDPNGTVVVRQVDLAFNARNFPDSINAAGSVTQLVHDAVGNLTQATDPNGHTTQHQVDALDRLVRTVDAIGGMTERDTPQFDLRCCGRRAGGLSAADFFCFEVLLAGSISSMFWVCLQSG